MLRSMITFLLMVLIISCGKKVDDNRPTNRAQATPGSGDAVVDEDIRPFSSSQKL